MAKDIKPTLGRKRKYPTPEDLQKKIDSYFKGKRKVMSLGGLCDYLNLTYEGFDEYGRREEYGNIVPRAKQKISTWINEKALLGEINSTVAIFNQKCNFKWIEEEKRIARDEGSESEHIANVISKLIDRLPS
jgi:hypothetical protein